MGTIIDYTTLSEAVQSFSLDRTDWADPMPDLVAMAEQAIYYGLEGMEPLRVLDMETKTSLTPTAGICTLPSNYLQWRRVVETSTPRRELEYIAPAGMDQQYATRSAGLGNFFTIIGLTIETAPLVANTVELTYYASPTALSSTAPTTSIAMLIKYPSIYLRATLAMGYEWAKMAKTGVTFRRQVR
jgi:hypothetical protein